MMTRTFRDKWLERLSDGSFRCFKVHLVNPYDPIQRCCLGVALAVAAELGLRSVMTPEEIDNYVDAFGHLNNKLSEVDRNLMGITQGFENELTYANDDGIVPAGQYYPDGVISLLQEMTVDA